MASELSEEQKQALWMLDRMRGSEEFLMLIRQQRKAGRPDTLDTSDNVEHHAARLAPLYQGGAGEDVELPEELSQLMAAAGLRDLASCPEELIEKAIAAYVKLNPKGEEDLPAGWKSTFALAEAEIRGEVKGQFGAGFVAMLAGRARDEQARADIQPSRDLDRERD